MYIYIYTYIYEFGKQISRRSCYSSPSCNIKNSIYLKYYIIIIATHLLRIATKFTIQVAKIASQLHKIISDPDILLLILLNP